MTPWKRINLVLLSAFKGWAVVTCLLILYGYSCLSLSARRHHFTLRSDYFLSGSLLFWPTCTLIVTLLAAVIFIVPYVLFAEQQDLLERPIRLFLEPALILLVPGIWLAFEIKAPPESVTVAFVRYTGQVLVTSLFSSSFYLRSARKLAQQEAQER